MGYICILFFSDDFFSYFYKSFDLGYESVNFKFIKAKSDKKPNIGVIMRYRSNIFIVNIVN